MSILTWSWLLWCVERNGAKILAYTTLPKLTPPSLLTLASSGALSFMFFFSEVASSGAHLGPTKPMHTFGTSLQTMAYDVFDKERGFIVRLPRPPRGFCPADFHHRLCHSSCWSFSSANSCFFLSFRCFSILLVFLLVSLRFL